MAVEDADAGTDREIAQFGEPGSPARPLWARSRVVALFDARSDLASVLAAGLAEAGLPPDTPYELATVEEQDWVRLTQAEFSPIRINAQLWIVPSWHDAPDAAAINIRLDPGMAFGTGSHATTRLCLDWLCAHAGPGCSVLDYGCGSGILAIAAAKLGANAVVGVDIDPQALVAARENARHNDVIVEIRHSSEPMTSQFDRVVANILTNPLCLLAPLLAARVAPGGLLALSGVLEPQAEAVRAAYAPYLALSVGAVEEGWARLEGQRT